MATGNRIHAAARRSLSLHILALAAAAVLSYLGERRVRLSLCPRASARGLRHRGGQPELKAKSDVDSS